MSVREWLRARSHLLVAFLGVTLVPAAALGWLGWRLFEQERTLEHERVRDPYGQNTQPTPGQSPNLLPESQ